MLVIRTKGRAELLWIQPFGLETHGDIGAVIVFESRILLEFLTIRETFDTNCQDVFDDLAVDVDATANASVGTDANLHFTRVIELGRIQSRIHDTGRASQAKQQRVRSTLNVHAIRDVAVPWNIRDVEVTGIIGCGETTHTLSSARRTQASGFVQGCSVAQTTIGAPGPGHFGVGSELQQGAVVRCTNVSEHFCRNNRDRGTDVFEVGPDTGSSQGLRGEISNAFIRTDFERRQDIDIFVKR